MIKRQNKKGQAGDIIQDTVGLIVVALLLIVFFIISSAFWGFGKKEMQTITTENILQNQEHLSLYSWLQKTIEIDINGQKQEIMMADLIRLSKIDYNYKETLDQEIKKAYGNLYDYNVEAKNPEEFDILSYEIITIGGVPMILPAVKQTTGSFFYIPSNETIFVNLEILNLK